jgi:ribonuclease HI
LNKDLITKIIKISNSFDGQIEYRHVKAHSTNVGNNVADTLAKAATKKKILKQQQIKKQICQTKTIDTSDADEQ